MSIPTLKEYGRLAIKNPDREGQAEIIELLQEKIDNEHGGCRRDFAERYGVSYGVVSSVLNRDSRPHYLILKVLGFEKVTVYRSLK